MTNPNLDAIAKLAPFIGSSIHDDHCCIVGRDDYVLDPDEVEAIANEWA